MLHQEPRAGQDPYVKDTPSLIASDKVEGTRVYGADGKHIGSIQRIILEKRGGRVAYAVLSFGGFSGSVTTITRCPGKSCITMKNSTATASILPRKRSKTRRTSPISMTMIC